MSNGDEKEIPSGIVKFTITREKMKEILSENFNTEVKDFSVEEEGISISLQPEKKEVEETIEKEAEEESEEDTVF